MQNVPRFYVSSKRTVAWPPWQNAKQEAKLRHQDMSTNDTFMTTQIHLAMDVGAEEGEMEEVEEERERPIRP